MKTKDSKTAARPSIHQAEVSATAMKVSATHLATRVRFGFDYLLHLPRGYSATRGPRWPLVVFFHGKGERGHDLSLVQRHGPPKRVAAGHAFPFILAAPQCAENEWWNYGALDAWVLELMRRHRVDSSRVYLTGLSMGGFATWGLAQLNPQRYAAVAPICGGGEVRRAEVLRDLPIWAFHGALDQAIPLQRSREMILAVKAAGGSPRFTIYPKAGHDSWTKPYAGKALYAWLLSHRRK